MSARPWSDAVRAARLAGIVERKFASTAGVVWEPPPRRATVPAPRAREAPPGPSVSVRLNADDSRRAARHAAKRLLIGHVVEVAKFGSGRNVVCRCGAVVTGSTDERMAAAFQSHRYVARQFPVERVPAPARDAMTAAV